MIGSLIKAIVRLLRCISNGRVDYVEDAAGYRTVFGYDAATGRRITVTDALTNTVYTAYDVLGRVTNTWGATYPVAYEYDIFGRMTAMKTWRDTNNAPDITQWLFDEATGLLTNKLYADINGPSYEYDASGRLTKRTWARSVVTDYAYDFLGQLTNINYSDSTPDVAFAYDRMGRQKTVTDGTGTGAESNPFGGGKGRGTSGAGRRRVAERAIRATANDVGVMGKLQNISCATTGIAENVSRNE